MRGVVLSALEALGEGRVKGVLSGGQPGRLLLQLFCLILLLSLASCRGKPAPTLTSAPLTATPTHLPFSPTAQSTIDNLQSTISPIPSPLSPTPQSTIDNPQSPATPIPSPLSPTAQSPITSPQSSIPYPQYLLSAQFNFGLHSLAVEETITYTNPTTQTLSDVMLVIPANIWPGAFQLRTLRWASGEPVAVYNLDRHRLDVTLVQPLPPGAATAISLGYALDLPLIPPPSNTAAPQVFGYTAAQSNLVDWYAYVAPYRDGWLVHDPGYWGEYQVLGEGDYRLELDLQNAPAGTVVAASAPPLEDSTGDIYHYTLPAARSLALSISPSYQVFSQTVDLGGSTVTVYSYAFVFDLEAGKAALAETARAVQLYSELFGPYPHASLSVVEADFLDGMEYDGLYFLSKGFYNLYDGTPDGYLTAIAVHETAHEWWYGLVANDQAVDPWLDEALCTFTERVYYEHFYPDALTRWWQPYRVDYYQPVGLIGGRIYDYASYRAYRDAVYLRGQAFLQALRQRIGDQDFFAFLKDYATRFRGQIATPQDFFDVLSVHSTVGIDDLVMEYFGR